MTLDVLKIEIGKLPPADRALLAEWLTQLEEAAWDEQIRADHGAGKLDDLINKARREHSDGTIREAP